MAEDQIFNPIFIVRRAKDGKSWSVFCTIGSRGPTEVPDFESEKAAQYWIDTVSKSWFEKRKTGRDV
jgi:hypothetical protein